MTDSQRPVVYVSSTYRDLSEHRATLKASLERAGFDVESMERYPAFDERPLDRCLEDVARSDVYVLLLAHRYGSRVPTQNPLDPPLSITEREYRHAIACGVPCLAFCVDLSYAWPQGYTDVPGSPDALSLHAFRKEVLDVHGVRPFTTPDNLAKEVLSSLSAQLAKGEPFPRPTQLESLRVMAAMLLEAGKAAWKMPSFAAPLRLEAVDGSSDEMAPISLREIASHVETGANLLLLGAGGVGKTVFLLELGARCLQAPTKRIPLYLDAAVWARSNLPLFDYLSGSLAARTSRLSTDELIRFAQGSYISLFINGWNEIAADRQSACTDSLRELLSTAKSVGVVLVSRSPTGIPDLFQARTIFVRGLTWRGQRAVLRSELSATQAERAIAALAVDNSLRIAARSPLILRGVVEQERRDAVGSSTFDLLQAVVDAFEANPQRAPSLHRMPLFGFQADYLEDLACALTKAEATNLDRRQVLSVLGATGAKLVEQRLLGLPVHPADVLAALCQDHLLHVEGEIVRFAHQLFLEFFAAKRCLRLIRSSLDADRVDLREAISMPSWDGALNLVLGIIGSDREHLARARLLSAAFDTDLGVCCEWAGGVSLDDGSRGLRSQVTAGVKSMVESTVEEIARLGLNYAVVSQLPEFADRLWALLENDNQQVRLRTYHLVDSRISLAQLGSNAEQRVSGWTPARRAEFVQAMGDNPQNFEFVMRVARTDPEQSVQAAAIRALFWNYPASDAALSAWLSAPVGVQVDAQLLGYIEEALETSDQSVAIRQRVRVLSEQQNLSDGTRISLALALPDELAESSAESLLRRLRENPEQGDIGPLFSIVEARRPQELRSLACELALQGRERARWPGKVLVGMAPEDKADLFEQAWRLFTQDNANRIDWSTLGSLANQDQVTRSLDSYLGTLAQRASSTAADINRHMAYRSMLAFVPGQLLLRAISDAAPRASYSDIQEFFSLLINRLPDAAARTAPDDKWQPSETDIQRLEAAFGATFDRCREKHDDVYIPFCNLAVRAVPTVFERTIVEACRRLLDAWAHYHAQAHVLQQRPANQRPNNPIWGNYLYGACKYAQRQTVDEILALFSHQNALDVLPGVIAGALNDRWDGDRQGVNYRGIEADLAEGKRRRSIGRAFQQPTDELQGITDEAARVLSERLDAIREEIRLTDLLTRNPRQAQYRLRALLGILSNLPSSHVVRSVLLTLQARLADHYVFPAALRALLRQGWVFDDRSVIRELEAIVITLTDGTTWIPLNEHYIVSELCELIYCVESPDYLSRPIDVYRAHWKRFANDDDIVRRLGALATDLSWEALLQLSNGQLGETYTKALANGLTPSRFGRFLEFLRGVTIPYSWTLDGLANQIAKAIAGDGSRLRSFIEACRTSQAVGKDQLALAVALRDPNAHEVAADYAIWMLDTGRTAIGSSAEYHLLLELMAGRFGRNDGYQLQPAARNRLRRAVFDRALSGHACSTVCRRLLSALECARREFGRPTDEPRHPNLQEPTAWTRVFNAPAENGN